MRCVISMIVYESKFKTYVVFRFKSPILMVDPLGSRRLLILFDLLFNVTNSCPYLDHSTNKTGKNWQKHWNPGKICLCLQTFLKWLRHITHYACFCVFASIFCAFFFHILFTVLTLVSTWYKNAKTRKFVVKKLKCNLGLRGDAKKVRKHSRLQIISFAEKTIKALNIFPLLC